MSKQTIVITGASSGIGKATARYFAEKGWNVAATMRIPEKEVDLTKIENIKIFALDVTNQASIQEAYEAIIHEFGTVDVLLNNAGYALNGPFELSTDEQIRNEFEVNVFGLFNVTRVFLSHFRENRHGVIVNISSMGGKVTFPYISTYHATKFAVEGFSESLSYELDDFGIRVKVIEPGPIATDFSGRSMDFATSTTITDYDAYTENFRRVSAVSETNYVDTSVVAEVIFTAATDETDQLRYTTDPQGKQAIEAKATYGDDAFIANIKATYSLKNQ